MVGDLSRLNVVRRECCRRPKRCETHLSAAQNAVTIPSGPPSVATRTPRDAHAAAAPHASTATDHCYVNVGATPNAARRVHGSRCKYPDRPLDNVYGALRRKCHETRTQLPPQMSRLSPRHRARSSECCDTAAALNAARRALVAAPNTETCDASRARRGCVVVTPPISLDP